MMKSTFRVAVGWVVLAAGACIAVCSRWIVSPGLERLLGIEMLVGRANVVYQPDGSYVFTNPAAMLGWTAGVAFLGVLLVAVGAVLLWRARPSCQRHAE